MQTINKEEFEKVTKTKKPVLVDFFATWCGPCKMLSPILEQVKESSKGEYDVVKVDIDESYDLAKKFGIMSVPTMIIFKEGEEMEKMVGLRPKAMIEETIKKYI